MLTPYLILLVFDKYLTKICVRLYFSNFYISFLVCFEILVLKQNLQEKLFSAKSNYLKKNIFVYYNFICYKFKNQKVVL